MILAKAPLRVSFFGGSSDIPAHYLKYTGATLSMAIDKYVYVSVMTTPYDHIKVSYSKQEVVTDLEDVQNEIVREALRNFGIRSNIEITTFADIPTNGTGLGGSSAFTCALVAALAQHTGLRLTRYDLADIACRIEIDMCQRNIGLQDQYASAFGGMNFIRYGRMVDGAITDRVTVSNVDPHSIYEYCVLVPTLAPRKTAHDVIDSIDLEAKRTSIDDLAHLARHYGVRLPNVNEYCVGLNDSWKIKREMSPEITSPEIEDVIKRCDRAGAFGSKLLGAGGGGYMLVMTDNRGKIQNAFRDRTCLTFKIADRGAEVVYSD